MSELPSFVKDLGTLSEGLSLERQKILSLLSDKKWFKKTEFGIQKKLFNLPSEFDGYLKDLTNRRDEYGGMTVERLKNVLVGSFGVLSIFDVRSLNKPGTKSYEYFSWNFGKDRGMRCLILFEKEGEITHFLLRKMAKFGIGEETLETIGTFDMSDTTSSGETDEGIEYQIDKKLRLTDLGIKRVIRLGRLATDPVMINSRPSICAVILELPGEGRVEEIKHRAYKTKSIDFDLIIEPIEKIWEYVEKTDESFFLGCVARLTALGVIKPPSVPL